MSKNNIPGKKVAVLGLGVSGYESALFLKEKGFDLFVTDMASSETVLSRAAELRQKGIEVEAGAHSPEKIFSSDWILISPGIPPSSPVVQEAYRKRIPVVSEIEAASWFCPSTNIVAVTGSSGKTTVTTLLGRVFEKAAGRTFVCGNIGTPWMKEIPHIQPRDFVILELSSFQLAHCHAFHPRAGLLLNLSPNHQDWHADMSDYAAAKLRIFKNQDENDFALIRKQDEALYFKDHSFKGRKLYLDEEALYAGFNPNEKAVLLTARLFGIEQKICEEVFRDFEGIEHRMEKAGLVGGVAFINDSKCTTTASLLWALEKFADQSVVLIAGGHPKSEDFEAARELIRQKVKTAVLIGEARPLLCKAWQGICEMTETNDFQAAVERAYESAETGDTVLLSPACASFDMFKNYIERGQLFKKAVLRLKERPVKPFVLTPEAETAS